MEDRFGHRAVIVALAPEPRHTLTRARAPYLVGPSFEAAEATAQALTQGMTPRTTRDVTVWLLAQWRGVATRDTLRRERDILTERERLHRLREASRQGREG